MSTVRVVNLSRVVDPGLILNKLGEFGKIINSRLGTSRVFPGVLVGFLIVWMRINFDSIIPSFLDLGNMEETCRVFSD